MGSGRAPSGPCGLVGLCDGSLRSPGRQRRALVQGVERDPIGQTERQLACVRGESTRTNTSTSVGPSATVPQSRVQ